MTTLDSRYPRTMVCGTGQVHIARMTRSDAARVITFANALPPHDLLFMRRDISQPKVVDAWVKEIEAGTIDSLVARVDGDVVGCSGIVRDPLSFSPHVAELRVVVSPGLREQGLGRALIQESFLIALDRGIEKLVAYMTADQRAAMAVFEDLGFRPEGLLRDHVRTREGVKHDIVILSHDVERLDAQMSAYGFGEAFD